MKAVRYQGAGVTIAADVGGAEDGPPVLFMHGGGQTRHSWGRAARIAADRGFFAVSIDLRGHGQSDWAPGGAYALDDYVADARAVIAAIGRPAAIVGASLGGLTGLVVAGETRPPVVTALVLVDVAPRIEAEGVDQIRGFMTGAPEGFASLEEAAAAVSAYLPHRPRPTSNEGLLKNLRLGEDGRYRWHWDPAMNKPGREAEMHNQNERLDEAARALTVPTLLVRGGASKVVSQDSVDQFRALVPRAEYVNVPGADHMVAGDRNDAFNDAVFSFLERTLQTGGA